MGISAEKEKGSRGQYWILWLFTWGFRQKRGSPRHFHTFREKCEEILSLKDLMKVHCTLTMFWFHSKKNPESINWCIHSWVSGLDLNRHGASAHNSNCVWHSRMFSGERTPANEPLGLWAQVSDWRWWFDDPHPYRIRIQMWGSETFRMIMEMFQSLRNN